MSIRLGIKTGCDRYKIDMQNFNARLSIYGMGDTPAFMIKGDARAFVMGDGMRDAPSFVIKGDVP
jgi:hypothetical protein